MMHNDGAGDYLNKVFDVQSLFYYVIKIIATM